MYLVRGYSISETIYQSATSIVFRGQRISDQAPVVLKMNAGSHPTPKDLMRYRREYEILGSLAIDEVISAYGLEEHENRLVLVEEDFGGDSLRDLLARHPFTLEEILEIAATVAATLSQIHRQCIVHKDVNPSNITYNPANKLCKLIDFGLAAQLSPTNPTQSHTNTLEGTLAYISPEQTGRVNRSVDYRSDLYSLGVTLYELLTGRLPFEGAHAIELIHAHVAVVPPTVRDGNPELAQVLSDLVAKLMAKAAEDRYQTAAGLAADLKACLHSLRTRSRIIPFELGQHDTSDVFYLPQRLYGREGEIATLLSVFNDQVLGQGRMKLLLVSGYSGTGKTSLVKEIQKPITQSDGYFIEGKFDQYQRTIPYYALKRALTRLVDIWLAESEARLAAVASALRGALGDVGRVMTDLVPALELVIGPQPEVTELAGMEAQNRFNYVCRSFFRCVSSARQPLVIFIDDLQWADLASLHLLSSLLCDSQVRYLFFIGAYRDNEVSPSHPLILMLEDLSRKGVAPEVVQVRNLSEQDLTALCADAFHTPASRDADLACRVHRKTLGNPFFATQFLKALYADRLIVLDTLRGGWTWDLGEIERRNIPDDVVRLMTAKILTLAPATQRLLTLAACIGNSFALDTLSVIFERPPLQTAQDLSEAVSEGLLIPYDTQVYRFSHDRIQQAAYALLENSATTHLRIGRLLLQNHGQNVSTEQLFEMVNQLDAARALIVDTQERLQLAMLNRDAGCRAKGAAAYASALRYFSVAVELLPQEAWYDHFELAFSVRCDLAWCLYYVGETASIEPLIAELLANARDIYDQVKVHTIRMEYFHLAGNYAKAVEIQKEALGLLGVAMDGPDRSTLLPRELEAVPKLLGSRTIEELEQAPLMEAPHQKAILDILMRLWTSAYLDSQLELVAWSSCKMTNISLAHGNSHLTSYGYMNYAFVCVAMLGQYETGHRFGKVAIRLAEKFDDLLLRGKVYLLFAVFVNHWRAPLAGSLDFTLRSLPLLVENGDWTYAGYGAEFAISDPTIWAAPCDELHQAALKYIPFLRDNAPVVLDEFFRPACLNPLLQLLGRTQSDKSFDDDEFSEDCFLDRYSKNPLALSYFYTAKLRSLYVFGHLDEALALFDKADFVASVALAQAKVPEVYFFAALTALASFGKFGPEERRGYEEKIAAYQDQMKVWAENSPANFLHKYLLVEAERAHSQGRDWDAFALFEAAIDAAKEGGYLNNEALAHECCARFLIRQGLGKQAGNHMAEARYLYRKWGAIAKVQQLDRDHGAILSQAQLRADPDQQQGREQTLVASRTILDVSSTVEAIDLYSIVQASQTIASEIDLEKLLTKMMKIVTDNAGADRAVLLSPDEGQWRIRAEARAAWQEVLIPGSSCEEPIATVLPLSLISFCFRKQESVVLGHACATGDYTRDPYFVSSLMKSVLCVPLKHSGTFKGALYLENSLVEDCFTRERIRVLELLSTQIAMSIDNAEFYRSLEDLVAKRNAELVRVNEELMKANKRLENLANIDGLTGIPNRRALDACMETEWKRHQRMERELSIIMCDIDHFKKYNDLFGHLEGDNCLRLVADAIDRAARRPGDMVARFGGEEFVVLLPDTGLSGVQSVVDEIREKVRQLLIPHPNSDTAPHVTLSLGVVHTRPGPGVKVTDALEAADQALYEAKTLGRNRAVIGSVQGGVR